MKCFRREVNCKFPCFFQSCFTNFTLALHVAAIGINGKVDDNGSLIAFPLALLQENLAPKKKKIWNRFKRNMYSNQQCGTNSNKLFRFREGTDWSGFDSLEDYVERIDTSQKISVTLRRVNINRQSDKKFRQFEIRNNFPWCSSSTYSQKNFRRPFLRSLTAMAMS